MASNFKTSGTDIDDVLLQRQYTKLDDHYVPGSGSNSLWGWGLNWYGSMGVGDLVHRSNPVQIGSLTNWKQISSTYNVSLAVKTDGTLWTWGLNHRGQLGLGNTTNYSSPVQVGSLTNWKQVSSGGDFTAAVKTDGTLWTWGYESNGALGLNTNVTVSYSSPVQVGSLTNWKQVSCGGNFVVAVKNDGTMWSWGDNGYGGKLGLGTSTDSSSPIQIGTSTNWKQVSCAGWYSAAITHSGELYNWGGNPGTNLLWNGLAEVSGAQTVTTPKQVGTLTNWKQVSVSGLSLAIKTDGTLWVWGCNYDGSLAGAGAYHLSSPVQIGSLTNWKQVVSGGRRGMAVKTDGTLWAWGHNAYGHLGLGDRSNRNIPVQVGSQTDWKEVNTLGQTTFVLKSTI